MLMLFWSLIRKKDTREDGDEKIYVSGIYS